jgi:hypothetical protein
MALKGRGKAEGRKEKEKEKEKEEGEGEKEERKGERRAGTQRSLRKRRAIFSKEKK